MFAIPCTLQSTQRKQQRQHRMDEGIKNESFFVDVVVVLIIAVEAGVGIFLMPAVYCNMSITYSICQY